MAVSHCTARFAASRERDPISLCTELAVLLCIIKVLVNLCTVPSESSAISSFAAEGGQYREICASQKP